MERMALQPEPWHGLQDGGWHISLSRGTTFRMEDGTSDSCGTACRMEGMAHQTAVVRPTGWRG